MGLLKKFSCLAVKVLILLICSNNIWGDTTGDKTIIIKLSKIVLEKLSENSSDELYFSVTKYSNKNESRLVRVPEFPTYWRSKDLNVLKNITLIEQKVAVGEEIQFILSLIEADALPFDPDNHIGSIQLNIINNGCSLIQQWKQPNLVDQTDVQQVSGKLAEFNFVGAGGKYLVNFITEVK